MKNINSILTAFATLALISAIGFSCSKEAGAADGGGSGKGGSMARFTIVGDYLYAVDSRTLKTVDISNPSQPNHLTNRDQNIGWDIETIFPFEDYLFIGSQSALYIYTLETPERPERLSSRAHFTSCDPVVAAGNYAYVTLSRGRSCSGGVNQLLVYDITGIDNPNFYLGNPIWEDNSVVEPKGLGVDEDAKMLFVCERGVTVFDLTNPARPRWKTDLQHIPEAKHINANDVIPMEGRLIVTAEDGIYQFDYSGENLQLLSIYKATL